MRRVLLRNRRWGLLALSLAMGLVVGFGLGPRATEAAGEGPRVCTTICEIAIGPVTLGVGQKVRVNVHNIASEDAQVTVALIDATSGKPLTRSQSSVVGPHQGASFDLDPAETPRSNLDAGPVLAGIRVSRIRATPAGAFVATLETRDPETGQHLVLYPPPSGQIAGIPPRVSGDWNAATWKAGAASSNW